MGIQHLNTYIRKSASREAIKKVGLSWLNGKVIAVDISIYLYRFLSEQALLENIYIMISLFRYYNITPIFVFDGKAPVEKKQLLEKRHYDKQIAEKQYNMLREQLSCTKYKDPNYKETKEELYESMQSLKKKFVRLKRTDIAKVQELMKAFDVTYIEADGEADELCARLVIKKVAYACLSEDMDLFVYGCPRVLRYLSLINETVVIYNLDIIISNLGISFKEFKEICIISGTDYNISIDNRTNLYKTLKYFELYKSTNCKLQGIEFYTWLDETSDYIQNIYQLYNIYNMFITDNVNIKSIKLKITRKPIDMDKIKEIMIPEGFIFL